MEIALMLVVRRAGGRTAAQLREDLTMLHIESGASYSMDPIGAEIWILLEHQGTVGGLLDKLLQRCAVAHEQCHAAVLGRLEEMHTNGMIKTS